MASTALAAALGRRLTRGRLSLMIPPATVACAGRVGCCPRRSPLASTRAWPAPQCPSEGAAAAASPPHLGQVGRLAHAVDAHKHNLVHAPLCLQTTGRRRWRGRSRRAGLGGRRGGGQAFKTRQRRQHAGQGAGWACRCSAPAQNLHNADAVRAVRRRTCASLTSRRMSIERLGVRMRVSASSTAECTADDTRVRDPRRRPSRLAATLSVTLQHGTEEGASQSRRA